MSSKEPQRVTTATGDPIKIIACPREAMMVGGELVEPGQAVEVFGYREISQIGTEPDPIRYCWLELYKSAQAEPQYIASKDGDWWECFSRSQAEEFSGAEAVREQYARDQEELKAREKRAELARGEVPVTLDEAHAKIHELEARLAANKKPAPKKAA